MKTVLFVPGFMEDLHSREYKKTLDVIKNKGYRVKFVTIKWRRTTIEHWVNQLESTYSKLEPKNTILAGFSYGAVTAFVTASKRSPAELWLFSLSARFKQDLPNLPNKEIKQINKTRLETFKKLDFDEMAKNIKCKTLIFVGEIEGHKDPSLLIRAEKAQKTLKSMLIKIPATPHDVTANSYLQAIDTTI